MYQAATQLNTTRLTSAHCGNGVIVGSLTSLRRLEGSVDMQSPKQLKIVRIRGSKGPKSTSAIAASPLPSKKMTLLGKRQQCEQSSQTTPSSPISAQVSTSSEGGCRPFWSEHCAEKSKMLWLPTAIGSHALPQNSSSGSFVPVEQTSWFNIQQWQHQKQTLQKTFSPSLQCLPVGAMDADATKPPRPRKMPKYKDADERPFVCLEDGCGCRFKKKFMLTKHHNQKHLDCITVSRSVRLYPNKEDTKVLRRWMGCSRYMYNEAVNYINENNVYQYEAIREVLTKEENLPRDWLKNLPSDARKYAVMNACDAFKSNFAKKEKDPSHTFEVKTRSKKSSVQQFTFEAKSLRVLKEEGNTLRLGIVDTRVHQLTQEGIACSIKHKALIDQSRDPILQMDKLGRFTLIIRYWKPSQLETQEQRSRRSSIVSLDPGVRTFMTTYSPDGTSYKLGDQASNRIYRLMIVDDKLQGRLQTNLRCDGSRMSKANRRNLRQSRVRLSERIDNLVTELHWKVANFLVSRYEEIVIPPFETAKMSKRYEATRQQWRKIGKKTTRQMGRLRHFQFRQRLLYLAKCHGVQVHVVTEEYTSKTCTNCGDLHQTLGGNKVFKCASCGVAYDRDAGGSRNILIKNMNF